jgi:hypothetical protein
MPSALDELAPYIAGKPADRVALALRRRQGQARGLSGVGHNTNIAALAERFRQSQGQSKLPGGQVVDEITLLSVPVEQGGALITENTPVTYLGFELSPEEQAMEKQAGQRFVLGNAPLDAENPNMLSIGALPKSGEFLAKMKTAGLGYYRPALSAKQNAYLDEMMAKREAMAAQRLAQDPQVQEQLAMLPEDE